MLKIINFIITKAEKHLSKKEKCLFNKNTKNEKLKLYRKMLDEIDEYRQKQNNTLTIRHYRYFEIKTDDIEENK